MPNEIEERGGRWERKKEKKNRDGGRSKEADEEEEGEQKEQKGRKEGRMMLTKILHRVPKRNLDRWENDPAN